MIEKAGACGAKPLPATDCCTKRNVEFRELSVNCAQAHFELFNVELFGLNHFCLANNIYLCIRYFLNI